MKFKYYRADEIDDLVSGLKETHYGFAPDEIIEALGITLSRVDADSPLLCGALARYSIIAGREYIHVSRECPDSRFNFTVAHELGHALLHSDNLAHLSLHRKDAALECEADYFAAKLNDIRFDPFEYEGMTAEQIAGALGISEAAVIYGC